MPNAREKRRRRGRPSNAERAARELPPIPQTFAGEASSTTDALAALDVAEKAATHDDAPDNPATEQRPVTPAPAASDKPRPASSPVERSTLTGRAFNGMQRSELKTALVISERENAKLREQLAAMPTESAEHKREALERIVGTVNSALFDLVALFTDVDEVRLDKDEERELGELGAPALEPYLRDYAKHAPLVAYGSKLTTVIVSKMLAVKAEKAVRAKDASHAE